MKNQRKISRKRFMVFVMICTLLLQGVGLNLSVKRVKAASYMRIKNVWQETYLYEDGDQVKYGTTNEEDQRSHWELLDTGDGSVRIKNRASGEYINIEQLRGYAECTSIEMDWYSSRWYIEDAGNNQKRICNSWQSSHYLHVETLQGSVQYGHIYDTWDSAKWIFENVESGNVEEPLEKPDLIITDITWSPTQPNAGDEISFRAIVKNQGTAASQEGMITDVVFSINGVDVAWSNTNSTSIKPGESIILTANGGTQNKVTWTGVEGIHNLGARVDSSNLVAEMNEDNNDYNKNITVGSAEDPPPIPTDSPIKVRSVSASSHEYIYTAENVIDNNVNTYWEGAGGTYPNTLTFGLGANANITSLVLKLNPNPAWSTRTQNIQVLGHKQDSAVFTNLVSSRNYTFNPATDNTVVIQVDAEVSNIRLVFTSNSGAGGGQLAELIVNGDPAPNPDLMVNAISFSPELPIETDDILLTATVQNIGSKASASTNVNFYLDSAMVGSTSVPALAAGVKASVSLNIGEVNAGEYEVIAIVDEENSIIELNKENNRFTKNELLVVNEVSSSDLVGSIVWTPSNPSAGDTVTFSVNLKNQGNRSTISGNHGVTLAMKDDSGNSIKTFSGSYNGTLASGASTVITMGTWIAVNGNYNLTCTVEPDENEESVKRGNNLSTVSLYSGRGANMPFTILEAEDSSNDTNGIRLAKNFIPGDFAGEASGRSAVYLDSNGKYVEFTLTSPANAFVLRNAVAENTNGTVSIYADNIYKGKFNVTSKFSYVYATPTTLGRLGYDNTGTKPYWLYEDSQLLLDEVFPIGTKIRIQKEVGDVPWIYVDMLETEYVTPPAQNPDPSKYVEVTAAKSIEAALNEFRQDSTKKGIFIPAGEWTISSKIFLYGRPVEIIGAGPWHTKLIAPQDLANTDVGFNISSSANGSTIKDLSAWGNYIYRVDGPGKFIDGNGMQDVTIDNVWAEHFVCLYWGVNASNNTFKNCRIKNMFADGINMTNGSSYNLITNSYARACGDDAFALFSAADAGGSYNIGNIYSNLTAVCTRRAASFAVYGGSNNIYTNLYAADTLTYPGITISSYSFGYNTVGFGDVDCVFDGVTLDRCGGDFWTSVGADDKINDYQNFGAIWLYSGDRNFKNILVKNVDINEPVYFGLQFQTMYPNVQAMSNVRFENININNARRYGIKFVVKAEEGQGSCVGEASFTNVKINNPEVMPVYGLPQCPNFKVNKIGDGNSW